MTELKIKLPEDFLQEEERSGYLVTSEIKKLWAVELDLTAELLRVCRKHKLRIYTSGGTTIGAVRHRGFIPWDDDIDFQMPREDYDILCSVAAEEFRAPYFFQTEYTDPGVLSGLAQLRNSNTTAVLDHFKNRRYAFNQGIFIDIFPLDHIPDDLSKRVAQLKKMQILTTIYMNLSKLSSRYTPAQYHGLRHFVMTLGHSVFAPIDRRFHVVAQLYRKYEKVSAMYNDTETECCSTYSFNWSERWFMKCSTFSETLELPFEFMTLPVAADYDTQLRGSYGDYMQCVHEESSHGGLDFSTDIPYNEYLSRLR